MRFCSFRTINDRVAVRRLGVVVINDDDGEEEVFEVTHPATMAELLSMRPTELGKIERTDRSRPTSDLILSAPLARPGKIVAAIVNTLGMLGGRDLLLDRPRFDMKAPSTVIGPGETILAPAPGIRPEVELASVVGKRITRASADEARQAIWGYTILNDVTAPTDSREDAYQAYRRDPASGVLRKTTLRGPLFRSKNHDTFCPIGPWLVTADELEWPFNLRMTTTFRGVVVQDGRTSEFIFSPDKLASHVSKFLTLEAGDVISSGSVGWKEGTPAMAIRSGGSGGRGSDTDPTEFILPAREGMLELEIEGIGKLRNPVSPAELGRGEES